MPAGAVLDGDGCALIDIVVAGRPIAARLPPYEALTGEAALW